MKNFYFKKKDKKVAFYDEKGYNDYINTLNDGEYQITIKKKSNVRTLKQNSYYWFYLSIISIETGELENDLHDYFKRKLLPPRFKTILGKEVKLPATTTELNSKEFTDYMEKISALTSIPIPDSSYN